jgi:hypothetical protein
MASEMESVVIENASGMMKAALLTMRRWGQSSLGSSFLQDMWSSQRRTAQGYVARWSSTCESRLFSPQIRFKHGIIANYDEREWLWHYACSNELRFQPSKTSVLVTEVHLNPYSNREKMLQVLFDAFDAPSVYVRMVRALSPCTTGRDARIEPEIRYGPFQRAQCYNMGYNSIQEYHQIGRLGSWDSSSV